jgi:hypothetical protein
VHDLDALDAFQGFRTLPYDSFEVLDDGKLDAQLHGLVRLQVLSLVQALAACRFDAVARLRGRSLEFLGSGLGFGDRRDRVRARGCRLLLPALPSVLTALARTTPRGDHRYLPLRWHVPVTADITASSAHRSARAVCFACASERFIDSSAISTALLGQPDLSALTISAISPCEFGQSPTLDPLPICTRSSHRALGGDTCAVTGFVLASCACSAFCLRAEPPWRSRRSAARGGRRSALLRESHTLFPAQFSSRCPVRFLRWIATRVSRSISLRLVPTLFDIRGAY